MASVEAGVSAGGTTGSRVPKRPPGRGGARRSPRIALLGSPNAGKSTVFNRLTGLRQRIANYPGITVEERVGTAFLGSRIVEVVDLPGAYRLGPGYGEEGVVLDALTGRDGRPPLDLLVGLLDAIQLESNLALVLQAAEFGVPMVVVLNQWDRAARGGWEVDERALATALGVPVVKLTAHRGHGWEELVGALRTGLDKRARLRTLPWPDPVEEGLAALQDLSPRLNRGAALAVLLESGFPPLPPRDGPEEEGWETIRERTRAGLRREGYNPGPFPALVRHRRAEGILAGTTRRRTLHGSTSTESIDRVLLHPAWGTLALVGVLWLVFQAVYSGSVPLMAAIETLTAALQDGVGNSLQSLPVLRSLVVDGVLAGVGGILVFLPQIFLLFLFLGLLDATGYLARAAFLMDRLFSWCGLNGKSFVPLLSSYACTIPGILAARQLETGWGRTMTLCMAPFMSCSARLPVYVLLIGAFLAPSYGPVAAGWALFGMHFLGLGIAVLLAWIAYRIRGRRHTEPFVIEMPPYRVPVLRDLSLQVWENGREFLVRAGTVILAFSVVIWALLYFPHAGELAADDRTILEERAAALPEEERADFLEHRTRAILLEDSFLGRGGQALQPLFAPAGFDWKLTVAVLASFPARELVVSTLGILHRMGPEAGGDSPGLRQKLRGDTWESGPRAGQPVYTIPVVVGVMVFFALCLQCGATVALLGRTLGWTAAVGLFLFMTFLAWGGAVLCYQVGTWILG